MTTPIVEELRRLIITIEHSHATMDRVYLAIEQLLAAQADYHDQALIELRMERIRSRAWEAEARRLASAAGVELCDQPAEATI